ncbi:MAG: hypothetical protein QNK11_04960 [Legionella sp.]|nr:hypothetical protein [Legionella sp.]
MPFNPREISTNFGLQPFITYHLKKAKQLLVTKPENSLTAAELANLALIYLEICNWNKVKKYADLIFSAEEAKESTSNEHKAIAFYALGVRKHEENHYEQAFQLFNQSEVLAESDWLKSHLLKNTGLVYLKLQNFTAATATFETAYLFTKDAAMDEPELNNLLPVLFDYIVFSSAQETLASDNPSKLIRDLSLFKKSNILYTDSFNKKKIALEDWRKSHAYILHCIHLS